MKDINHYIRNKHGRQRISSIYYMNIYVMKKLIR